MDLIGAEIFDVGKWNGLEFSDDDLNGIADAFDELSSVQKVPIKLGHNDKQPMTDGQPSLGWVHRVYRQGSKLVADITDIPRQVYDAIKNRLYRTVSVELLKSVEHKGSSYPWVLDAVALLGADQPAVNTLDDLGKLTARRMLYESSGERFCFEVLKGNAKEVEQMSEKKPDDTGGREDFSKLTKQLEEISARNAKLENELKAEKKLNHDREAQIEADKLAAKRDEINERFNDAIKSGTITPAQREEFTKLLNIGDDAALKALDLETFNKVINADKPDDDATKSKGRVGDPSDDGTAPDEIALNRAHKFMAEHGETDLGKALDVVFNADPKLAREYVDITGTN